MLSNCRGGHVDGKNLGSGYESAIVGLGVLELGVGTFSVFSSLYCLSLFCFYYYVYVFLLVYFIALSLVRFCLLLQRILLPLSCFCFVILFCLFLSRRFLFFSLYLVFVLLFFSAFSYPGIRSWVPTFFHSLFAFPPTMSSKWPTRFGGHLGRAGGHTGGWFQYNHLQRRR